MYLKAIAQASFSTFRDGATKLLSSLLPPTLDVKDHPGVGEALEASDLESLLTDRRHLEIMKVSDFKRSPYRKLKPHLRVWLMPPNL